MENVTCIVCDSKKSYLLTKIKIYSKVFTIMKCMCGFVYLDPRPDKYNISKYYDKKYFPHNTDNSFIYKLIF